MREDTPEPASGAPPPTPSTVPGVAPGCLADANPPPARVVPAWEKKTVRIGVDLLFGVVLPAVCLYFDPIVFRHSGLLNSVAIPYAVAAYGFFVMVTVPFLFHMIFQRGGWVVLSGLMAGTLGALTIGLWLLPLSLLGTLFAGIGLLGLTPFATAWVYFRRLREEFRRLRVRYPFATCFLAPLLTAGLWLLPGYWAQTKIDAEIQAGTAEVLSSDEAMAVQGEARLQRWQRFSPDNFGFMVEAYMTELDAGRRQRLAAAYLRLTGGDIETEVQRRMD